MAFLPPDLTETLADDPEVAAAVKQLTLDAIAQTSELLRRGSPQIRFQVVRMLVPTVTRTVRARQGEDDTELKAAQDEMYRELRRAIGGEVEP